jgi:hypothetical protein
MEFFMNSNWGALLFCCVLLTISCHSGLATIEKISENVNRLPPITPDYTGITIPPNIAPMHFFIHDSSSAGIAEISSNNGRVITCIGKKGKFFIDPVAWKRLLSENTGNLLHITIYSRDHHGTWYRYRTIENFIAAEPIDRYCTYRLLNFQYNYSRDLRECQRDLTSFSEKVLISTQNCELKCVNCHTPNSNDPSRFTLQVRSDSYGSRTLITNGDSISILSSQLGHTSWHPNGRLIAFAAYKVQQYFHAVGRQFIDVYDNNSGIIIYDAVCKKIVPVPKLNQTDLLQTWPAWSADGCHLYFCRAAIPWKDQNKEPPENFNKTKYSLMRIAYDATKNSWGDVDTVLCSLETGLSISQPKLSPDNKFCLFCMQEFGAYPHAEVSSDLYLMDIATGQYHKLPVNSEYNEGWHSWSKNNRWILFSSKRGGGIFTRLYISHIDSLGNAGKPFLLPQQDPLFYDSFIQCYNVAEFAIDPVRFSARQLLKAIQSRKTIQVPVNTIIR